jgi:hypothetical protein
MKMIVDLLAVRKVGRSLVKEFVYSRFVIRRVTWENLLPVLHRHNGVQTQYKKYKRDVSTRHPQSYYLVRVGNGCLIELNGRFDQFSVARRRHIRVCIRPFCAFLFQGETQGLSRGGFSPEINFHYLASNFIHP